MFRLKVSLLRTLTTFSLPDALPTLGSHSVYNCGIHLVKTFQNGELPKSPHSDYNTVDKNSIEQSIEQCQHPGEGAHIHKV